MCLCQCMCLLDLVIRELLWLIFVEFLGVVKVGQHIGLRTRWITYIDDMIIVKKRQLNPMDADIVWYFIHLS